MINFLVMSFILLPFIGGIICYFLSKRYPSLREKLFIAVNTITFLFLILIGIFALKEEASVDINNFAIFGLHFKVDMFRFIYALVSIFLWEVSIIFSKEYMHHYENKDRYYFFYMLTLCGVNGVFLSNDLYTTFIFFELMSFASYPLVVHDESEDSLQAGHTYLTVAVISGMMLLLGMILVYSLTNSFAFDDIKTYVLNHQLSRRFITGAVLMLLGFGAKAGMYPLHIWLPKAHPVAPAPASSLLSGILTKTGVFGIIVLSANIFFKEAIFGNILLFIAVITMFLGALLGLFSINLKRTLACSSMSQIGFILVGISFMILLKDEGGIAQAGTLLHMVNHSLIKLLLFNLAGVIAMNIHALDLNTIQGYGRKKPFFKILFLIGSLGIMGIPFFNGYASKTLIHEAIVEFIHLNHHLSYIGLYKAVEWIFLISGGLTIAYMSKLFTCIFIKKNNDQKLQEKYDNNKNYLSLTSKILFAFTAVLMIVIGVIPNIVVEKIIAPCNHFFNVHQFHHHVKFFNSWACLSGAVYSLIFGITFFSIIQLLANKAKEYKNYYPSFLDLEKLIYKPVIFSLTQIFIFYIIRPIAMAFDYLILGLMKTVFKGHAYKFNQEPYVNRFAKFIYRNDEKQKDKMENFISNTNIFKDYSDDYSISFSYAFMLIGFGFILILGLTILLIINL